MRLPYKEAIAMFHSGSNTGFNLVTQVPIPVTNTKTMPYRWSLPPPAFSANGSKFAVAAYDGTVSVFDVRNKTPLTVKEPDRDVSHSVASLKFSSGIFGREVLAFTEVSHLCLDIYFPHIEWVAGREETLLIPVLSSLTQHRLTRRSRKHSTSILKVTHY